MHVFLGVGKNAANISTGGDMGWTDCFVKQYLESCRLYCKLTNITDKSLGSLNLIVNVVRNDFIDL